MVDRKSSKRLPDRHLLNGWPLFWLLSIPVCVAMVWECLQGDLRDPHYVSHLISYSVRWSVPFIVAALAASSLRVLFNHPWTHWLLRNRKEMGLVFAVAMGWQGAFIFLVSSVHFDYYYTDIYYLRDELEGSSGYLFLAAMVLTSFKFGRQAITPTQWRLIHKSGIYFLWAYPYSVYWWNIFYYDEPRVLDYLFYWAGFLAFAVRIAAWAKLRRQRARAVASGHPVTSNTVHRAKIWLGYALLAAGLAAAATGRKWQETASNALLAPNWSAELELWLPYWPFQPFLPLFVLGLAALCLAPSSQPSGNTHRPMKAKKKADSVNGSDTGKVA
ncbi:MAG: hypothetical protein AAF098_10345 [Pseudomonadota bacterium]